MSNPKDIVRQVLDEVPDNVTYGDIMYNLHVSEQIERELEDMAAGRTPNQEEMERK